jgi:L-amino acid N-acyltransferase YncA
MSIRPMREEDGETVLRIYSEGIDDRIATFETQCPTWDEWRRNHLEVCRLVAEDEGGILGWGALSPVSGRVCYRGVAEVSVYIARKARGRGTGFALLAALIKASEKAGFWTLQASTFEENRASLRLQLRCGFRIVGRRERISRLDGHWRDTVITERRSWIAGVDP